ncbi:MAG: hypothetical protein A3I89_01480 [Candidatus Harrisonbacteria bacterium RIFCSPLOWO2_02_FULL_41_11]|uniref:Thioredoxin domain-containing protein n=1 Tax=Candidatus Harrisonbacteria bacterium RIFCSPHIGHO2_02_FULL_42_16 TaxID=1798404 RepID=A0A1G1ZFA7_9BACT|nr:MAG: hypothetical protein A3B92_04010 [Candidatus Harrisonbacteria bacterium RIFCSPHIGHO2_02_FULL_42_16]OGY66727.1 MAG: hypothetical protein A3I89_01480 [Candidatus Harrisonbacteria bacterium RIFCSPLOWO2_02_FULL_41_11]
MNPIRLFLIIVGLLIAVVGVYAYINGLGGIIAFKERNMPEEIKNFLSKLPSLPKESRAPDLVGIQDWLNSEPLILKELRGRVVLIDFWTYSCINCIRTLPHVEGWHEKYKGNDFVLIGVHTPEFDFEKKKENVAEAIKKYHLTYPVALDNDYRTWNAFANRYWPAHYLIDKDGYIRYKHFGEGSYAETESAIQQLLLESGQLSIDKFAEIKEPPPDADFSRIGTPEIYLGYKRLSNIGNMDKNALPNKPFNFYEPENIEDNRFYFSGTWNIQPEFSEFVGDKGKLIIRYKANKVNIVLSAKDDKPVKVIVKLDGVYLTENNKGKNVIIENGKSVSVIQFSQLYNFSNTGDDYGWHTLELDLDSPGLRAFAFTFG